MPGANSLKQRPKRHEVPALPFSKGTGAKKRAVFFDAGLTLIQSEIPLAERSALVARKHGFDVTAVEIEAVLPTAMSHMVQSHRNDPNIWSSDVKVKQLWTEYYLHVFTAAGMSGDLAACVDEIYMEYNKPGAWTLYSDVIPTLRALRDQGYTIGVISDWNSTLPANILLPLGVGPYISFMIVSTTQREAKPGAGLYFEALSRAGVQAEEAVHIGDNYVNDILGARAAGITGVLLDRDDLYTAPIDCLRIRTLMEIPGLLVARLQT